MASERRVIGLDVELEDLVEGVCAQKRHARRRVRIVLMGRRLLRLWLDEERAIPVQLLCVVDRHAEELGEMIELTAEFRVKQVLIPLAATPKQVVLAAEFLRHFHRLLDLGPSIGEYVGVATRARSVNESLVAEEIGGAPEELDSSPLLLLFQNSHDGVEIFVGLGKVLPLGGDVAVVKAIVRTSELLGE